VAATTAVSQRREDAGGVIALAPGTRVEVRNAYDRAWGGGFEVVGGSDDGYRVRRLSDGSELPATFAIDDVRRERRDPNMWWI
jgi:hypothetical protein